MPDRSTPRSPAAATLLVVLLASAGGCGGESEAQRALADARREVAAISTGSSPAMAESREKALQSVTSTLRSSVDSLEGADAVAGLLLLGDAYGGLATLSLDRVSELERRMLNLVSEARSSLGLHQAQMSLARALEAYDATRESQDLVDLREDQQGELARFGAVRDERRAKLEELTARAKQEMEAAERLRREAIQVRQGAADLPSAQRAEAAERAYEIDRRADGHEKTAAELNAAADVVRPQLATLQYDLERIERQIELVDDARGQIEARRQARAASAAEASASAAEAASRFDDAIRRLLEIRDGESSEAFERAGGNLSQAVATYRKAASKSSGEQKSIASLGLMRWLATQGDAHRAQARIEQMVAGIVGAAAEAAFPLPDSRTYATLAQELDTSATESLDAAAQAYRDAQGVLGGGGGRGGRETAERLTRALQEIESSITGVPIPEEPSPDAPSDPGQPAPEAAPPAEGGEGA